MNAQNPEDREFQELLQETPLSPEAPEGLKGRLRTMVAARPAPRPTWKPRLAFAAAGMAAVAVGALLLWPTQASAKSLQKVVDATNEAASFLLTVAETRNGKTERVQIQAAGSRIDIRTENGERIQIDGARMRVYDPKENTLTTINWGKLVGPGVIDEAVRQGIGHGLEQIDVKQMVSDFKARYGEENARISDVTNDNGRQVYTIDLQKPQEPARAKITVDANTDLPIRIQAHEPDSDADIRLEFWAQQSFQSFDSALPKDVKRIDLDVERLLQQGLKGARDMNGTFGKFGENIDPKEFEKLEKVFEGFGKRFDNR